MSTPPEARTDEREGSDARRWLLAAAVLVTAVGLLHHADHVIRGDLVVANGLPENWNHSGWPFQDSVTAFTASLGVYLLLVPGIVLTLLGRVGANYWIGSATVIGAIVVFVHFVPLSEETEYPSIIYSTYEGGLGGVLALVVVFALVAAIGGLGALAVRARRRPGDQSGGRNRGRAP